MGYRERMRRSYAPLEIANHLPAIRQERTPDLGESQRLVERIGRRIGWIHVDLAAEERCALRRRALVEGERERVRVVSSDVTDRDPDQPVNGRTRRSRPGSAR
jgi:hypothetical protein